MYLDGHVRKLICAEVAFTVSTRGTFGLFFQQPCHVSLNIASMDLVSVKLFLSFHYFLLCIWIIWEKFSCFHVLKQQYHVMHKIYILKFNLNFNFILAVQIKVCSKLM